MDSQTNQSQEQEHQQLEGQGLETSSGGDLSQKFVDNRPEALSQKKLQKMADNSPESQKAAKLQAMLQGKPKQQAEEKKPKANKTGLPDDLKSGVENLSGQNLDDVQVHYNSDKPEDLDAHAYAQGSDIYVAPGQEQHLAHELWHVVQQKEGRVAPTVQTKDKTGINDDDALEKEADIMGAKAQTAAAMTQTKGGQKQSNTQSNTVQRLRKKSDNSNIDISKLSLVKTYDILNRKDPDPDPDGVFFDPSDRIDLMNQAQHLLPGAFASLQQQQVSAADLAVMANRNVQVDGPTQQLLMDFMEAMDSAGHVIGFEQWIAYTAHLDAEQRQDHFNEIWEAARQLLLNGKDNIDLRENVIAGSNQTADLSFDKTQIEVKTVRQPITRGQDLNGQLAAGLAKFDQADVSQSQVYEVTIYASIEKALLAQNGSSSSKKNIKTQVTANASNSSISTTRSRVDNGQVVNQDTEHLPQYVINYLNTNPKGAAEAKKVSIIMENARSFEITKQANNTWSSKFI